MYHPEDRARERELKFFRGGQKQQQQVLCSIFPRKGERFWSIRQYFRAPCFAGVDDVFASGRSAAVTDSDRPGACPSAGSSTITIAAVQRMGCSGMLFYRAEHLFLRELFVFQVVCEEGLFHWRV